MMAPVLDSRRAWKFRLSLGNALTCAVFARVRKNRGRIAKTSPKTNRIFRSLKPNAQSPNKPKRPESIRPRLCTRSASKRRFSFFTLGCLRCLILVSKLFARDQFFVSEVAFFCFGFPTEKLCGASQGQSREKCVRYLLSKYRLNYLEIEVFVTSSSIPTVN